jgi:hypothetical protein
MLDRLFLTRFFFDKSQNGFIGADFLTTLYLVDMFVAVVTKQSDITTLFFTDILV